MTNSSADEMDFSAEIVTHVDAINSGLTLFDIAFENLPNGWVIDAVPRDIFGGKEAAIEGFRAILASHLQATARKMMYTSLICGTLKIE